MLTRHAASLRGQSLVPTLTTLSIAALGVGLLTPLLGARQQDTAKARSMRNLQTLARATRMYSIDWSGRLPGWQKNPNGTYSHNVWDQQIYPYVGANQPYFNGLPNGIRSWADPDRRRVLSYGLNGMLIVGVSAYTGSIRATAVANEKNPYNTPILMHLETIGRPHDTILLAELATEAPVPQRNADAPFSYFNEWNRPHVRYHARGGGPAWNRAMDHWIDISPREFIENATPTTGSYDPATWNPSSGIARDLYGGGGNYAFVDGHVEFLPIGESVGLGKIVSPGQAGSPYQVRPGAAAWRIDNIYNRWKPGR